MWGVADPLRHPYFVKDLAQISSWLARCVRDPPLVGWLGPVVLNPGLNAVRKSTGSAVVEEHTSGDFISPFMHLDKKLVHLAEHGRLISVWRNDWIIVGIVELVDARLAAVEVLAGIPILGVKIVVGWTGLQDVQERQTGMLDRLDN